MEWGKKNNRRRRRCWFGVKKTLSGMNRHSPKVPGFRYPKNYRLNSEQDTRLI